MKTLLGSLQNLFSAENEFFAMAKKGKRITHIAVVIPLVFVFIIGSGVIAFIPGQLLANSVDLSNAFIEFYNLFVAFGLIIFFVWLWVRFFEKRSFKTIGFTAAGALKKYFSGFFSGIIMLSIVIGLMAIFGTINSPESHKPFSINILGTILFLLLGYIIQGAAEETVARGWQFQVIGARYKPWLGAVVSSVIFALLHGFNEGISLLAFLNLFLFAFLLIIIILRNKSIWAACGWHTAWNWTMENIYGLEVSGTKGVGSVFNLSANGPSFITGGEFGPEGSIFTTIVLLGGMIVLLILESKNK